MIEMKDFQPIQTSQMPKSEKIKNMAWGVINATLFRITPPLFGYIQKAPSSNAQVIRSKY